MFSPTSIVQDELHNVPYLTKREAVILWFACTTMDPGNYSIGNVVGLDSLKAPVAHSVEEQERLLADPLALVGKCRVGLAPLLSSV